MGQNRRGGALVMSGAIVLVGQFSAGVSSALADETCCVPNVKTEYPLSTSLRPLSDAVPGWSTAYRVEQLGKNGVKLVASGGENSYAFSLMGSNAVSDADTDRKSTRLNSSHT